MTIERLAREIKVSSQYLSEIERGGRKCLNDEKTAVLSDVLALSNEEACSLLELAERVKNRAVIPADVRAYIEENPDIIAEIQFAMERGLSLKAC